MADRQMQWVENAAASRPSHAEVLAQIGELYHKKLWHQLTTRLEEAVDDDSFASNGFLIDLYQNFISGFAHKLNLLKLSFFAVAASKQTASPADGAAFLQDVIDGLEASKQPDADQPILYLRAQIAQFKLVAGDVPNARASLAEAEASLASLDEPDPAVAAAVHYLAMQLHKSEKDYAAFFRAALRYLAHCSVDSLPPDHRLALAVDVSLAALLGKDVYAFGELLLHPIMGTLQASEYAWLCELLDAFHHGDIGAYDAACSTHAALLNSQPALVEHERRLREKITVLSLVEMVAGLPAGDRTLSLSSIAERTKLPSDGVEFLLMKALALHLIEGKIDQVAGTVSVTWVAPRVLTLPQVEELRGKLGAWADKVTAATAALEQEAVGVVEMTA